jgi:integrase
VIKVPRLKTNRHGVFCIRIYWRDENKVLRESLHSLHTKDAGIARILALQFNESFERKKVTSRAMTEKPAFLNLDNIAQKYKLDIGRGIMEAENDADHERMMQAIEAYRKVYNQNPLIQEAMAYGKTLHQFTPPQARQVIKSKKFSEATTAYLEEKKHQNVAATILEKNRTYKDFIDIFGDLEINLISKAELVQWKTADLKRNITANRINKRLGQVNDFFNWAINHGHYTAHPTSPVDGLFIKGTGKLSAQTEHYEPFTNDDLKNIFNSDYATEMAKPDHYWIPIVAMFSGARREEIASLKASNVKIVDGVACFQIEGGKTIDARRVVPIHPQLQALGFMTYAQHVKAMGQEYLFPYLIDGQNGRGKNAGRQFSKLLDKHGITDDRKVLHSFRHSVITRLHSKNANPAHVMQITGHKGEAGQTVHFGTYTHDVGLKALADTLEKLSYALDFEIIKLKDPTFKGFLNRWKVQEERKAKLKTVTKG